MISNKKQKENPDMGSIVLVMESNLSLQKSTKKPW